MKHISQDGYVIEEAFKVPDVIFEYAIKLVKSSGKGEEPRPTFYDYELDALSRKLVIGISELLDDSAVIFDHNYETVIMAAIRQVYGNYTLREGHMFPTIHRSTATIAAELVAHLRKMGCDLKAVPLIQTLRAVHPCGLKDAKEAIEAILAPHIISQ